MSTTISICRSSHASFPPSPACLPRYLDIATDCEMLFPSNSSTGTLPKGAAVGTESTYRLNNKAFTLNYNSECTVKKEEEKTVLNDYSKIVELQRKSTVYI